MLSRALISAALLIGGCTYDGTLEKSFYKSKRTDSGAKRTDLKVAIVNNTKLQETKFKAFNGYHGVDIAVGDSIAEAVRTELQTLFTVVKVVKKESAGDYDLYAYPTLGWVEIFRNSRNGHMIFDVRLDLRIKGSTENMTVGEFHAKDRVEYYPPAEAIGAQMVTGGTLFLASPITVPFTTWAIGKEAKRVIHKSLDKLVAAVGKKVERSNQFASYHAMTKPKDAAAMAPPPSGYKKLTSPYDKFLEGVVVIQRADSLGTGFFITVSGYIVTNNHVVGASETVMVKTRDGSVLPGKLVDSDATTDLALLKIARQGVTPLGLSDGAEAGIGRNVLAIGTPKGLSWSVSKGIVSAVRDTERARFIQTDAAINSGNSGGPLIDLESGLVIGVNTLAVRKDVAEGLNFAVSTEDVWRAFRHHFQR